MRSSREIWWLSPAFIVCAAGAFIGFAAYAIPDSTYRIYWRVPKFFALDALAVTLACAGVFALGTFLATAWLLRSKPGAADLGLGDELPLNLIWILFRVSFYLC